MKTPCQELRWLAVQVQAEELYCRNSDITKVFVLKLSSACKLICLIELARRSIQHYIGASEGNDGSLKGSWEALLRLGIEQAIYQARHTSSTRVQYKLERETLTIIRSKDHNLARTPSAMRRSSTLSPQRNAKSHN